MTINRADLDNHITSDFLCPPSADPDDRQMEEWEVLEDGACYTCECNPCQCHTARREDDADYIWNHER